MPSLRTSALLCGGIFALIVGLAALGNLAPAGTVRNLPWLPVAAKVVFLTLAVAFAFAIAVHVWLTRTMSGKAVRATSQSAIGP